MKVKFLPQNIEVEVNPNKSLLQIATENQIEIRSICKGVPSCAECRVKLVDGENNCFPPTKAELNLIGTNYFIDGRRLSCQVRCFGDVTVDLTEQVDKTENQTKKIRGYRQPGKQAESHAVNDTMLLAEKIEAPNAEDKSLDERPAPQQKNQQQRQGQNRQRNPQAKGQQQGQGQQGPRPNQGPKPKQNQNPNQNPGQNQGPKEGGGGQGGQGKSNNRRRR